jgi:hypothetical protein
VHQDHDPEADNVFAGFALLVSVAVCRRQNRTSATPRVWALCLLSSF